MNCIEKDVCLIYNRYEGVVIMGFQDDWVMRQIEMMARFVANVVFGKKEGEVQYEIVGDINDTASLTHEDMIHMELMRLIKEGDLCTAEDMLFDNMVYSDKYIELATDFYQKLNALTDEQLEAGDFSRDEVYEGYLEIMSLLGVPVDVFGQADRFEYQ